MTERIFSHVQAAEMEFLRKKHDVTLHNSVQLRNLQSLECWASSPPNREIPATLVRPCVQNAQRKADESSPAGYTHGKATQGSSKDQVEWLHLQPCLGSSRCGKSRIIWNCCWAWGISSPPTTAASATLPRGTVGVEINEWLKKLTNLIFGNAFSRPALEDRRASREALVCSIRAMYESIASPRVGGGQSAFAFVMK